MAGWIRTRLTSRSKRLLERFQRETPEEIQRGMQQAVFTTSLAAQAEARAHAPVFMGTLSNSIQIVPPQVAVRGGAIVMTGSVESSEPYAIVQEEGRRPGARMPPAAPIERWVELKGRRGDLDLEGRSIRSVAYLIRRKIARKGTPGKGFFEKARKVAERVLRREVDEALGRALR